MQEMQMNMEHITTKENRQEHQNREQKHYIDACKQETFCDPEHSMHMHLCKIVQETSPATIKKLTDTENPIS